MEASWAQQNGTQPSGVWLPSSEVCLESSRPIQWCSKTWHCCVFFSLLFFFFWNWQQQHFSSGSESAVAARIKCFSLQLCLLLHYLVFPVHFYFQFLHLFFSFWFFTPVFSVIFSFYLSSYALMSFLLNLLTVDPQLFLWLHTGLITPLSIHALFPSTPPTLFVFFYFFSHLPPCLFSFYLLAAGPLAKYSRMCA